MTSDSSCSNSDYISEGAAAQTAHEKAEEHVKKVIATHESKAVLRVRVLFFMVLAASAIGVALGVYFYTSDVEDNEFRNQYESDAAKILQSIGDALDNTLSATDNFATGIVSQKAVTAGTEFPFVKVPNFPIQAAKLKTLAKAFSVGVQYLVSSEQRTDWEVYAKANNEFVAEAWELQAQDESFQNSLEIFPNIQDELYVNFPEFTVLPPDSGPHLVSWQQYPLSYEPFGAAYNFDFFAIPVFSVSWIPVLEEKRPSLSSFSNLVDPTVPITDPTDVFGIAYVEGLIPKEENAAEPIVSSTTATKSLPSLSFSLVLSFLERRLASFILSLTRVMSSASTSPKSKTTNLSAQCHSGSSGATCSATFFLRNLKVSLLSLKIRADRS
jgi:hypothetical protein